MSHILDNKVAALKNHLDIIDDPARKLKFILEHVGHRIDEESKRITKGILQGLDLKDLQSVWNLLAHDLFEVESLAKAPAPKEEIPEKVEEPTQKKKNVRSRKTSR